MFETCTSLDDLNRERVEAIRSGHPAVAVNKAYAKMKASILANQSRSFKKLSFVEVPFPDLESKVGIDNVSWDDTDPYTLYVEV